MGKQLMGAAAGGVAAAAASGERCGAAMPAAAFDAPLKPGKGGATPILVSCSSTDSQADAACDLAGAPSPAGTTGPGSCCVAAPVVSAGGAAAAAAAAAAADDGGGAAARASIASTLDGHDAVPGEAVPATRIAARDVAAGCYKTGVRYCLETWPDSAVLRALDTLLATSSMLGYTATILLLMILGAVAWWTSCLPLAVFVGSITLSVLLPAEPLLWEGFQRSTLVSSWRRYFKFSFVVDHKLDQQGRYIFAAFPHGVFPVSELLCVSLLLRMWPRLRVFSICASSVFKVPVWRHILCWTGARPATAAHFRRLLAAGGSVSLVPGGIAEMFLWEERREVIKIRDRRGFVRIAVETGTPLVPVYHFGNSRLFSWVAPAWLEWACRRARVAMGYPAGRWGTLLPINAPLFMAVGSPIPVPHLPRSDPGFEPAVEAAHAALVAGLEELYHKYKSYYGWQDRELVIT